MTVATTLRDSPAVSVVIATYNRSQVLHHTIRSVLDSSFTNWELIVVGDACTDDTAACVEAFADERIRFVNLPNRCGDQSGPNNRGVELARGRYTAFLNHDDLYLPQHLATCVAELDLSEADLIWTPCASIRSKADAAPGSFHWTFSLRGVPDHHGYSPFAFYFASSWVFRRSLASRVGPWRAPARLYVTPSQDWLFRAWRSGASLRFLPKVGVVVIGTRPSCYANRESLEHEQLATWLKDGSGTLALIFEQAAITAAMDYSRQRASHPWPLVIGRVLLRPLYALLSTLGIHPGSLSGALAGHGRRGHWVREHTRIVGSE